MLTKSRLEEFHILLSTQDPDLIFLSVTHWSNHFNVKLKNYHSIKQDRVARRVKYISIQNPSTS